MKVVFMGTPDFAVGSLKALLEAGYEIVYVVTAPDKYGGRGGKQLIQSDVKRFATENGLPILQPERLRDGTFIELLKNALADIFVVVAFRMLPRSVWSIPPMGTINVHGSLLPAYRGAAPINWAIISGEQVTGVTTFMINEEIDTGNLLKQAETSIGPDENAGDLYLRLKSMGSELLLDTLSDLQQKRISPIPQDESRVSHAPKLNRENCKLRLPATMLAIHNQVRGLSPFPGAWLATPFGDFKILETCKTNITSGPGQANLFFIKGKSLWLSGTDYLLEVKVLQQEGKRRMEAAEFIAGWRQNEVILAQV